MRYIQKRDNIIAIAGAIVAFVTFIAMIACAIYKVFSVLQKLSLALDLYIAEKGEFVFEQEDMVAEEY